MKLTIKQLGKIEEADIEIKNLTVFVGKNSTNKSYMAHVVYILNKVLYRLNKIYKLYVFRVISILIGGIMIYSAIKLGLGIQGVAFCVIFTFALFATSIIYYFLRQYSIGLFSRLKFFVYIYYPFVYIWGGEPFMYPDLMPLMRYMKEKNIIFSVVTNGTWLKENAEEIVDAGWDALMLSLDGPKHIHDSIRGKEGTFDTLMEGIQAVKEEKAKRNSIKPYIMMLSTTTKDNAAYLSEIFQAAEDCGADCLVSYYAWFTTQEIGDAHQRIMMERLGVRAEAWKGYLYSFDEIDTKILQENVDKVKNTKWKIPYVMIPDLTIEQIPIYYKEVDNFFGYNKCTAPWLAAELMPNGDVSTCRDYPDYITGNIQEEGILEIFHGEKFNKFRKTLRDVGMFPICARCCGLMGF